LGHDPARAADFNEINQPDFEIYRTRQENSLDILGSEDFNEVLMAATRTIPPLEFPSTHWSQILQATDPEKTAGRQALERLLRDYYNPLCVHLEFRFRCGREQAMDWLQGFIEHKILENQLLAKVHQDRGRFRTFLLASLDHFVLDEMQRSRRKSRLPEGGLVPLDGLEGSLPAEQRAVCVNRFEVDWARALLERAVASLRDYYKGRGRPEIWEIFNQGFLRPALHGVAPPAQAELAKSLGLRKASQVSNLMVTGKRKFRTILRALVAQYTADESEVDAEIRDLMAALFIGGS